MLQLSLWYRKVFFVSEAKRKSQIIRDIPAINYAECIISVQIYPILNKVLATPDISESIHPRTPRYALPGPPYK